MTSRPVMPGAVVAGCRVERCLSRTRSAAVYLAHDPQLDRPVALKLLDPAIAADPAARRRLLKESRTAAGLEHPSVVPVYTAGEVDGTVYLAMRFVDGPTLRERLRRGPMAPAELIDVLDQVAAGLDAAHARGLVHRDVKPSNILLDSTGHAYLSDFGITTSLATAGRALEPTMVGTVDYVPPEQVRGDAVDGRGDVYALSCLAFEALTGHLPFVADSDVAMLFAHLEQPPPRASSMRPELPAEVDAVLARGMAKDPRDRPGTAGELVSGLRAGLGLTHPAPGGAGRDKWLAAAAAAVVVLLVVALVLVRDPPRAAGTPGPVGHLVTVSAVDDTVTSSVRVAGYPNAVAAGPSGVWVADFRTPALWRVPSGQHAPVRVATTGEPRDLAQVGRFVYVAGDGPQTMSGNVSRFDAATGQRLDAVELLACALGSGEGVVWAAGCPAVQRLSTGRDPLHVVHETLLPFPDPQRAEDARVQFRELAVGGGSLWVLGDALDRRLWRLDARTGQVEATVPLDFPPRSLATAAGGVWVTDPLDDRVVELSMATGRPVRSVAVGPGAAGIAAAHGSVWVASALAGSLTRLDARTGSVLAVVPVGGRPREVAVHGDTVWVTTQ